MTDVCWPGSMSECPLRLNPLGISKLLPTCLKIVWDEGWAHVVFVLCSILLVGLY